MLELKDPAFKLFGRTIPMPTYDEIPASKSGESTEEDPSQSHPMEPQNDQKNGKSEEEEQVVSDIPEDTAEPTTTSTGLNENPKTDQSDKETPDDAAKTSKHDNKEIESSDSQENTVKKPDKVLPCPRCNSLDTKFCYYNNYNVNQPRHFCKNCQRYWTAGGTMRNVPVGAGRRKNKHSTLQNYRPIMVSDTLTADAPNPIHCHHDFKPNGTVLSFGPDSPLCKSMTSVLNLVDSKRNEFHVSEDMKIPRGENGEENSSVSTVTASNSVEEGNRGNLPEPVAGNYPGFGPPVPCFPGTPWPPYPWNAGNWGAPPPAFCASSFPVPFYPAGYWGCPIPGGWSVPWIGTVPGLPSPSGLPSTSSPNSPLGKHARDGNTVSEKGNTVPESSTERCLWIPKTLRIDDPEKAVRSSIWETLGIKNDKAELIGRGGMFKAFQSKADDKNHVSEAAQVLNANPAALSRSLNFHENL